MNPPPAGPPWWWPTVRPVILAFAWLACLGVAGVRLYHARHEYNPPADRDPEWNRAGDGNVGHTLIDFGGQWVMARMVATGHAAELYDRNRQWAVVRAGFPRHRESDAVRRRAFPFEPSAVDPAGDPIRHDDDNMMLWVMGKDSPRWTEVGTAVALPFATDAVFPNPFAATALVAEAKTRVTPDLAAAVNAKAVGGPLYPPVHGFVYAPLGFFADPADAYAAFQWASVGFGFVAGFAASRLSRGRVWWPVATTAIFLYPGCRSGLDLGQNALLTLAIVLAGWALMARGWQTAGGAVWGLLAFKPVWAAAFLLVPLLTGRWRFGLAMVAVGAGSVAATLPFTGLQPWWDWLTVGAEAAGTYDVNKNWIELSRDLHGIPRRMLLDFKLPEGERHNRKANVLGWSLWAAVLGSTTCVYLLRADRRNPTGLGAGFLFLGAFLGCYHFMYYDALLSAAGVAVLFADPCRLVRFATGEPKRLPFGSRWAGRILAPPVLLFGLMYLCEIEWSRYQPRATVEVEGWAHVITDKHGDTARYTPHVSAEIGYYHPWETLLALALWAWCGWRLAWGPDLGHQDDAQPAGRGR